MVNSTLFYRQTTLVVLDVIIETGNIFGSGGNGCALVASEYHLFQIILKRVFLTVAHLEG